MAKQRSNSLAEIMGTRGGQTSHGLTMANLPHVLGEAMPELPRNAVGRHRLIRSLQQRFGPNFRSLPGVSDLMKEFDGHVDLERRVQQIKSIKYKPKLKENK